MFFQAVLICSLLWQGSFRKFLVILGSLECLIFHIINIFFQVIIIELDIFWTKVCGKSSQAGIQPSKHSDLKNTSVLLKR